MAAVARRKKTTRSLVATAGESFFQARLLRSIVYSDRPGSRTVVFLARYNAYFVNRDGEMYRTTAVSCMPAVIR